MESKPIKRSEEFKALSRDHHFGLLFCWKMKEGLKAKVELDRLKKYVNYFWDGHLKNHFLDEEALLFNRFEEPVCVQAKQEHLTILNQIEKINAVEHDDAAAYDNLVKILNDHIRYEERVVFPYLEQLLPVSALNGIAHHLEKERIDTFTDNYQDEFWIK